MKTLYRGADILILDEPTAVLTPQETDELFETLRTMVREKGMTVILITHKLYEVTAVSDRVGVMRQGKLVGIAETSQVTERQLAAHDGRPGGASRPPSKAGAPGEPRIVVENLEVRDTGGCLPCGESPFRSTPTRCWASPP